MAGLKSLKKEAQKEQKAEETKEVKETKATKEAAEDKPKLSPEELKAQRIANLKPKTKDPLNAKADEIIIAAVTDLFKKQEALGSGDVYEQVKDALAGLGEKFAEKTFVGKKIRNILRTHFKCERTKLDNSINKSYMLPK